MLKTDLQIIDTHVHLDMNVFDKDCFDVISRAKNAHITNIIDVGKACEKLSARTVYHHHRVLSQSLKFLDYR